MLSFHENDNDLGNKVFFVETTLLRANFKEIWSIRTIGHEGGNISVQFLFFFYSTKCLGQRISVFVIFFFISLVILIRLCSNNE